MVHEGEKTSVCVRQKALSCQWCRQVETHPPVLVVVYLDLRIWMTGLDASLGPRVSPSPSPPCVLLLPWYMDFCRGRSEMAPKGEALELESA